MSVPGACGRPGRTTPGRAKRLGAEAEGSGPCAYEERPRVASAIHTVLPKDIARIATSWVVAQQAAADVLPGGVRFWADQASEGRLAGAVWRGVGGVTAMS